MGEVAATPDLKEDLKHAHAMLARMSPEELLVATYAMEDILEGAVYVSDLQRYEEDEVIDEHERLAAARGRKDLAEGRTGSLEDLLDICGLTMDDLGREPNTSQRTAAASPEALRSAA